MTATNSITGDLIQTKPVSTAYSDGWELIFGKKEKDETTSDNDLCDTKSDDID